MVDFYFITSIVNMFWQICTILFVLYRFTTFFSFLLNFTKFLGKILNGILYIKEQINVYFVKRSGYSVLTDEEINNLPITPNKSFYSKLKEWFFGRKNLNDKIPLYETRTSFYEMHNNIDSPNTISSRQSKNDIDFENHMQNLLESNYDSGEFYKKQSSIYSEKYNSGMDSNLEFDNLEMNGNLEVNNSEMDGNLEVNNSEMDNFKRFGVNDSNILFNSNFLMNMLSSSLEPTEEIDEEEDEDVALRYSLMNSDEY
jgi:hypothetical protein